MDPAVRAFPLLLLVMCVSAENTQSNFCDSGSDKCDRWKEAPAQSTQDTGVLEYEQLKHIMSTGRILLVDVREADELQAGFILGATHIALGDLKEALDLSPSEFRECYGTQKPRDNGDDLVVYCQRGLRSLTALQTARGLGYARARHYAGGYNEWLQREPQ